MKRIIKFRAWDKKKNRMIYQIGLCSADLGIFPVTEDWDDTVNIDYLEIMQFTGLLDKNGKEIYDGDILIDDEYPEDGISYAKVEWYKNGFFADPWFGVEEFTKEAENYEVVGNIYENPELLKDL